MTDRDRGDGTGERADGTTPGKAHDHRTDGGADAVDGAAGSDRRVVADPETRDADAAAVDEPRSAGYRHLARAVLYREYLLFIRYPANAVGGLVVSLLFFGFLFYGGRAVAGQALTDSIDGIVVGYFLWTLSVGAYSAISNDIGSEVQWGTLERHVITPFGFAPVALLKGVAKIVRSFVVSTLVLAAMLVVTGTTLQVPVITVVVVAGLSVAGVLGLGFAAGGVTLLYKRIGNWLSLLQFGFAVLISAPSLSTGATRFLPLVQGATLLRAAMIEGTRLWEVPVADLAILFVTGVGYVALGSLVFGMATNRARRLGVLGDY